MFSAVLHTMTMDLWILPRISCPHITKGEGKKDIKAKIAMLLVFF